MIFPLLGVLVDSAAAQQATSGHESRARWILALHGGAGRIQRDIGGDKQARLEGSLRHALSTGKEMLAKGGAAIDVVETVVVAMEDDPRFNAGKGPYSRVRVRMN
jgi:L-asparaginase / beta-aspartyl-peptidase